MLAAAVAESFRELVQAQVAQAVAEQEVQPQMLLVLRELQTLAVAVVLVTVDLQALAIVTVAQVVQVLLS
jgi:hypothetical protein